MRPTWSAMEPLEIEGAWTHVPRVFEDERGNFLETFGAAEFQQAVGYRLAVAQTNISVSRRRTLRGIHLAAVPPGQAKYVTCISGAVMDVVVDVRVGSATFGQWSSMRLDDVERRAMFIAEGLGHAFLALTDNATVVYLCSEPYRPEGEREINALDPALAIDWPEGLDPVLSPKDAAAPTLREAEERGLLPSYSDCQTLYAALRVSG